MKIRVAVCEADVKQREYLTANLLELPLELECREFTNGYDLKKVYEETAGAYDMVFVAATFHQRGDGLDLVKYIRERSLETAIILMADNRDYYKEAYDSFVMAYMLKPLKYRELERCFNYYTKNSKTERRASWMVKGKGGHWRRIYCREIVYIESDNREILVHLSDGSCIESYAKLADVEEQLPKEGFIRCHQSYIINVFYVNELQKASFQMGNLLIPISRKYQRIVKERYYQYMFGRM